MSVEFHTVFDESGSHEMPIQVIRTLCPECRQPVMFVVKGRDLCAERMNQDLLLRLKVQRDEIIRLNKIIDKILSGEHFL